MPPRTARVGICAATGCGIDFSKQNAGKWFGVPDHPGLGRAREAGCLNKYSDTNSHLCRQHRDILLVLVLESERDKSHVIAEELKTQLGRARAELKETQKALSSKQKSEERLKRAVAKATKHHPSQSSASSSLQARKRQRTQRQTVHTRQESQAQHPVSRGPKPLSSCPATEGKPEITVGGRGGGGFGRGRGGSRGGGRASCCISGYESFSFSFS